MQQRSRRQPERSMSLPLRQETQVVLRRGEGKTEASAVLRNRSKPQGRRLKSAAAVRGAVESEGHDRRRANLNRNCWAGNFNAQHAPRHPPLNQLQTFGGLYIRFHEVRQKNQVPSCLPSQGGLQPLRCY